MNGGIDRSGAALWRRWREAQAAGEAAMEPDALTLAAYAENRLGRPGGDPEFDSDISATEAWLTARLETLDDIAAARRGAPAAVSEAVIRRAQELVAQPGPGVIPFRPRPVAWRAAAAWSGIAASLLVASFIGFSAGAEDWLALGVGDQASGVEQELLGPTNALFGGSEENGT
jgi:hypothetical protein